MKSLKKFYESIFYSEYGSMMASLGLLTLLFVLSFIYEIPLTKWIVKRQLTGIPFVFEFGSIVLTFLIVNICRRAINTSNRTRMVIYAFSFAIGSGFAFTSFIHINWLTETSPHSLYVMIGILGRGVIAAGLLIGSIVSINRKIKWLPKRLITFILYFIAFVFLSEMFRLDYRQFTNQGTVFNQSTITIAEYLIATAYILTFAIHFRTYTLDKNRFLLAFMNGIGILILSQIIRLLFIDYTYLFHLMYTLFIFIGYIYLYNSIFGYNIVSPIQSLINDEKQIKLYAENLEVIVERRTTEMKNNNMRLIQEIEYAKSIQQSLLPARKVNFNKVVFVSEYFPCERLSGDFFDIYRLDDENIGMYVLDVSGHGVSAALMTMFCNNYIKSSEKLIMKYRGLKPHRNLKHFYEEFNKMKFPDEMYMVMFFASYNLESGILTYSSGGINCYPIVMKKDGNMILLDKSQGFPICKMSAFFTPTFTSESIQLDKGDRVIFYTDGLVDNVKNSTISEDVLERVLFDYKNRSIKSLNNKIKSYIHSETGESEDDITYFIMEV